MSTEVGYLATVPTIMQRLLPVHRAKPDSYDLTSVCVLGGIWPRPAAEGQGGLDRDPRPDVVWELYGGTELQALTFISGAEWLTHRGSVGGWCPAR